jgi:hypothetical protein
VCVAAIFFWLIGAETEPGAARARVPALLRPEIGRPAMIGSVVAERARIRNRESRPANPRAFSR